ncbi:DUF4357 domain-containing protein [Tuberibacillus sp. Marseille-P3662]|uniref:DUF4357 domain-containing protein n=1 Tax=Tuberibacillus sp. Marseille-P3662 TaxID=1965358 RepID=UPI000A1CA6CE|nr:DUF4357 domain-containing protein [Tuberibacillus sp. Marseille-P3662]
MDQTIPTQSFVPEWRQADLFDIFGTMKLLLSTLGYPVFEPLRDENSDDAQADDHSVFYCKSSGITAKGELTYDGFVVFEGSGMVLEPVESFKQRFTHHMARIEQMIDDGVVIQRDNKYIFQTDYLFNSPSMAADCILKRSSNGWVEWKDVNGRTLDEVKRKV